MESLRVLVVHDSPVLGEGLGQLLRSGESFQAESRYAPLVEAAQAAVDFQPRAILVDFSTDRSSVEEIIEALRRASPDCAIVALAADANDSSLTDAAHAGVRNYVLLSSTREQLIESVSNALAGEPYLPPTVAARLLSAFGGGNGNGAGGGGSGRGSPGLSPVERRLLRLVVEGLSNRRIANRLGTSERTVARRLNSVYAKLHADDRVTAIRKALKEGFVTP